MDHSPRPDTKDRFKNLAIALLVLVVVVETGILLTTRGPGSPGPDVVPATEPGQEGVSIAGAALDAPLNRNLWVSLDRPLFEGLSGTTLDPSPVTIAPEAEGSWRVLNPYTLIFAADPPLKEDTQYTLALSQEGLPGKAAPTANATAVVRTGKFLVESVKLDENPAPEGGAMALVQGSVRFNTDVTPEAFLEHVFLHPAQEPEKRVELNLLTGYPTEEIAFQSALVEKTAQPLELVLTVKASLTPRQGDLPLGETVSRSITLALDPVLRLESVSADRARDSGTITLNFSSPVTAREAEDFVTLTPEASHFAQAQGTDLILTGDFLPGADYRVAIRAGLTAADGARLEEEAARTVTIPDIPAQVGFRDQGMFLSRSGLKNLAVESVNLDQTRLTIDRVFENNVFPLFQNYTWLVREGAWPGSEVPHALGDRVVDVTIPLKGSPNQVRTLSLDLEKHLDVSSPGFYKVALQQPGGGPGDMRWVLLTDLGLAVKEGKDGFLVWTVSFATGNPLDNVEVELVSDQNQVLATGRTEGRGLCELPLSPDSADGAKPFLVRTRRGDDLSFLVLDRFRDSLTGLEVAGKTLSTKGYTAYIYGERDIYRPGEMVHGLGVVRDARLAPPAPMPLRFELTGPQGRELARWKAGSTRAGLVPFTREIPSFFPTGSYTLNLLAGEESLGSWSFQVEEFVPDRISVRLDPGQESLAPGENATVDIASRYLFGPPAEGLRVRARATLVERAFSPKGWEQYRFLNPEASFQDMEIAEAETVLDDNGTTGFSFAVPDGLRPPSALSAMVLARVMEHGGRGVAARTMVDVHPYPAYLGLKKLAKQGFDPGEEISFQWAAVAPDGKAAEVPGLKAGFFHDRWQTVVRRGPDGGLTYESKRDPRLLRSLDLNGGETGSFTLSAPHAGSYRVVVENPQTGASASQEFFAGGWGWSPWAMENPARVEMVLDKKEYAPGETAQVQIRAPFPGRLLVTLEDEQVLEAKVDGLSGNTATFSFPVKRSYEPNVYVCAMLVRKASSLAPGEPGRALGAVSLNVARESNRIPVALFLPGTMRPDGPLEIEVTAEPGAEITIAAVDEGIHQLTTAKGPDPFAFFYAKRALMTKWYDIFAMLLPEVADRIAPPGGGQGMRDMAQFLRSEPLRRTRPLSFWSGVLSAGADGKVRWSVDIPDFNGAVRVTAVAVKDKRFGKAASLTRVRSPLILTPTFPRFLSLDEEFLVPVTLRNDVETGDGEPEFTVELGARGPVLVQDPARKVTVPRGREQTVWFRAATMDRVGEARFTVRALGAGERAESQAVIGLRAPLPPIRFLEQGSLEEAEQSFALDPPRTLVNGTRARDFRVGSLPMIRFSGRLSELLRYPFGCAEQAVSRAFPLMRFADLARVLDPSLFDETTPQAMVQSAITRLRTMQTQDGGFSMWPGGSESAPWISVYAAHFLAEARAAGYSTAGGTLDNALGYVSWQARVGQDASGPEIERAAYAAFVLAFAGRPDRGAMDFLNQQLRDKLDSEAAFFLGAAYALSGDPATYQELSALAEQKADKPEGEATFGPNLDSPVRSPALRLTALLAADPGAEAVPRLVEELSRLLSEPGALSTQEAGFALTALGGFFARQQKAGPLAGKVLLGQDLLGSFDQDTPLAVTGVESEKPLRVEVTEGFAKARVFWSLTTRGAPEAGDYEPESSGLEVKREVFDRNGRPLENGEVLQGDLLAVRTRLRSTKDAVSDVVVQELLPVGLEVENPGLASSETLYWMEGDPLLGGRTDLRDDRVVLFTDLPDTDWRSSWTLLRAVTCGNFTWPPVQAEAMYRPSVRASGKLGGLQVIRRR